MRWNVRTTAWAGGLAITAVGLALAGDAPPATETPGTAQPADRQALYLHQQMEPVGGRVNVATRRAIKSRYRNLLKQVEAPKDRDTYGDFCDYGYWAGTEYAGQSNLPAGYWVYFAPNWYIFQDDVTGGGTPAKGPRAWSPEQATGAPDTWPNAGDIGTAWASQTQDGQREWLELTYDAPVRPVAVTVYETYNPGAVDRITGFDTAGNEVELWNGSDPVPAGREKGIAVIAVQPEFDLTRIRVYVDSPKVPGWNEIDAVGLLDAAGTTHWAKSATASSTYADNQTETPIEIFSTDIDRLHVR